MPRLLSLQRGFPCLSRFPGTPGTLGFWNPSIFSSRLAPEIPQTSAGQFLSLDGSKFINRGSCLNLARLPGSRKGGEREKFLFAPREKQGRTGGNLPYSLEDFCEPRKPVPFQTSQNTLCFCLCLLKTSSCCRGAVGALFILFEQQPET